ncbi:hypothetical protein [Streptomyces sp. NPDC001927]
MLLSWRGEEWNSLAVTADDVVVGHVMWAYDDGDGVSGEKEDDEVVAVMSAGRAA